MCHSHPLTPPRCTWASPEPATIPQPQPEPPHQSISAARPHCQVGPTCTTSRIICEVSSAQHPFVAKCNHQMRSGLLLCQGSHVEAPQAPPIVGAASCASPTAITGSCCTSPPMATSATALPHPHTNRGTKRLSGLQGPNAPFSQSHRAIMAIQSTGRAADEQPINSNRCIRTYIRINQFQRHLDPLVTLFL
jgi:hypothetical protein